MNLNTRIFARGHVNIEDHISDIEKQDFRFLNDLRSNFAIIYTDKDFQFAAVDRIASIPLYYKVDKDGIRISGKVKDLYNIDDEEIDLNGLHNSSTYGLRIRNERTPFSSIKRILPGSYVVSVKRKWTIHTYWKFQLVEGLGKLSNQAFEEKIIEALQSSITYINDFDKQSATHLSGGLDSSLVTELLAKTRMDKVDSFTFHAKYEDVKVGTEEEWLKRIVLNNEHIELHNLENSTITERTFSYEKDPGNWFFINSKDQNLKILDFANRHSIKTILTGLGGDELLTAKYSRSNLSPQIKSLLQLKFYNNKTKIKQNLRRSIRSLPNFKFRDSNGKSSGMNRLLANSQSFYTKEAQKSIRRTFHYSTVSIGYDPLSLAFRNELLNQIYFTVRSDLWNYLGQDFDVTFIHPLLEKNLLELSANLPLRLFQNSNSREWITAVLEKGFPSLKIPKGKLPQDFELTKAHFENIEQQLELDKERTGQLRNSISNQYFNFNQLENTIRLGAEKLKTAESMADYFLIMNLIARVQYELNKAEYIQSYG